MENTALNTNAAKNEIEAYIREVVEEAKTENQIFIFNEQSFSPEEAECMMIDYWECTAEENGYTTIDEVKSHINRAIYDAE